MVPQIRSKIVYRDNKDIMILTSLCKATFSPSLCLFVSFQFFQGECAALSRYLANVPILSVVSCCSWSRWKTLIPSERPTVGIKLIREIKIMNYCKGVKNIQFPLQPKTILIPSMVPPIRLKDCLLR